MTDIIPLHERPELSAAALREWSGHVEHVLRGIGHSLNNRAAALAAVLELARDSSGAGAEDPSVLASILTSEVERVTGLVAVVRSIAAPRHQLDAFVAAEAAAEALAVLKLHAEQRDRRITFDSSATPLRVPRWMFVRALIALTAAAARDTEVRIVIADRDDWLDAYVDGASPAPLTPLVAELARGLGGEPLSDRAEENGRYGFRVPTLSALRRLEGRGG